MHAMYSRVSRGSSTAPPPTQLVPDLLRQPALPLGPQRSDELLSSMPLSVSEQSITVSSETVATVAQLGNQETGLCLAELFLGFYVDYVD